MHNILQDSQLIPDYPFILQFVDGCDRLNEVITLHTIHEINPLCVCLLFDPYTYIFFCCNNLLDHVIVIHIPLFLTVVLYLSYMCI